jgi:hypothetical protein
MVMKVMSIKINLDLDLNTIWNCKILHLKFMVQLFKTIMVDCFTQFYSYNYSSFYSNSISSFKNKICGQNSQIIIRLLKR